MSKCCMSALEQLLGLCAACCTINTYQLHCTTQFLSRYLSSITEITVNVMFICSVTLKLNIIAFLWLSKGICLRISE